MTKTLKDMKKKLTSKQGFTVAELLVTLIIISLAGTVLVSTIQLAVEHYNELMTQSESKTLCSTLTTELSDEFRYSTSASYDASTGDLYSYFSPSHGKNMCIGACNDSVDDPKVTAESGAVSSSAAGQIVVMPVGTAAGTSQTYDSDSKTYNFNKIVSGAGYTRNMKAAAKVTYDATGKFYHVELHIYSGGGSELIKNDFDVIPVSTAKITAKS